MTSTLARLAAALAILAVAACSTDPYQLASEDREYGWRHAAYYSLVVAGIYDDPTMRREAEVAFAYELGRKDVTVVRSMEAPGADVAALAQGGVAPAGSGLLTITTVTVEAADAMRRALPQQGLAYLAQWRVDGATYTYPEIALLHVALWDLETRQLVWQATTDSYGELPAPTQINGLALNIANTLRQRGLI